MPHNEILDHAEHNHALPQAPAHNKRSRISICESEMNNLNRNGRRLTRLTSPTSHNTLALATKQLRLIRERAKTQNGFRKGNGISPKPIP